MPWLAAGFAGTFLRTNVHSLGTDHVNDSVTFGGQVGYMWKSYVGGEFLANFAPSVEFPTLFLADDSHVNSYMANVIGSVPLGEDGHVRPYISAGVGAITLHTTVFAFPGISEVDTVNANASRFASNIGGGLMVFIGHVGVRGDVRHFRATRDDNLLLIANPSATDLTKVLLSGLTFWRSDAGIVVRW